MYTIDPLNDQRWSIALHFTDAYHVLHLLPNFYRVDDTRIASHAYLCCHRHSLFYHLVAIIIHQA